MLLGGSAVSLRDGTSRQGEGANPSLALPKSQFSRESFQFVILRKRDSMSKFEGAYGEDAMFELCPRRVTYFKPAFAGFFVSGTVVDCATLIGEETPKIGQMAAGMWICVYLPA